MENINLALTLLLAGFIIVFMVLVLLIIIITIYGKLVQAAQKKSLKLKEKNKRVVKAEADVKAPAPAEAQTHIWPTSRPDPDEIPGEVIAAIAAAVDAVYGSKPHRIRSVRRSGGARSAWGNTGVMQNTRPF